VNGIRHVLIEATSYLRALDSVEPGYRLQLCAKLDALIDAMPPARPASAPGLTPSETALVGLAVAAVLGDGLGKATVAVPAADLLALLREVEESRGA